MAGGDDFLFTAKPDSHKALYDFMAGAEIEAVSVTRKEGAKKLTWRCRWFKGAPLREGKDAMAVDWIGLTIFDAKGKQTYGGALAHQPGGLARERRGHRRLRPRAMENRERKLQRSQEQRLSSRTQLRSTANSISP